MCMGSELMMSMIGVIIAGVLWVVVSNVCESEMMLANWMGAEGRYKSMGLDGRKRTIYGVMKIAIAGQSIIPLINIVLFYLSYGVILKSYVSVIINLRMGIELMRFVNRDGVSEWRKWDCNRYIWKRLISKKFGMGCICYILFQIGNRTEELSIYHVCTLFLISDILTISEEMYATTTQLFKEQEFNGKERLYKVARRMKNFNKCVWGGNVILQILLVVKLMLMRKDDWVMYVYLCGMPYVYVQYCKKYI